MNQDLDITDFFTAQEALKLFHWTTDDYNIHMWLNDFYEEYQDLVDELVECFLGIEGNRLIIQPVMPMPEMYGNIKDLMAICAKPVQELDENSDIIPSGCHPVLDEFKKLLNQNNYFAQMQDGEEYNI